MWMRTTLILSFLAAIALTAGCGPTRDGVKSRADARGRLAAFNSQLNFDQATQAFEVGRFDVALRQINEAIRTFPDAAAYHLLRGRICLETHRLEDALRSFEAAMERDDQLAEAHYFTGIVFQRWSDDEAAYKHYSRAAELDTQNVQYLLASAEALVALGELNLARQLVETKLAYFEYNAAMRHLLGQIALMRDDPATAADFFAQARLLSPEDPLLAEELAWAQFAAGRFADCYDSVTQLRRRLPQTRGDLIRMEARCLAMMERSTEARDLYLQLIKLSTSDVDAWVELGTVSWEIGDFHRVAMCSVRVLALAPDRFEGYLLKGIYEREKGDFQEAARLFEQAASRAPDQVLPQLLLGQALEDAGDFDGASAAYARAARLRPDSTHAHALLEQLTRHQRLTTAEGEQWLDTP